MLWATRQAEHLPDDDLERRRERRAAGDLVEAVADRSRREQVVDERVDVRAERRVRRELRMDPPPGRRHVDHPDVVEVRGRDAVRLDEPPPGGRAAGQQHAVDRVEQPDEADRDVADVDDAVVREHRRVRARVREEAGIVAQHLERRLRLDRPPEPILEIVPHGGREDGVDAPPDRRPPPSAYGSRCSPRRQRIRRSASVCTHRRRGAARLG